MHIHVIVNDGTRVMVLDTDSEHLPCHRQWPLAKKIPRSWHVALIKHVTFGLFGTWPSEKPRRIRPFGLKGSTVWSIRMSPDDLGALVLAASKVRKWTQHHARFDVPWSLKLVSKDTPLDLVGTHCLRHFSDEQ